MRYHQQDAVHPPLSLCHGNSSQSETATSTKLVSFRYPRASDTTASCSAQSLDMSKDRAIDLYYKSFYGFHACVLRLRWLEEVLEDTTNHLMLTPLASIIRFIRYLSPSSWLRRSAEFEKIHTMRCLQANEAQTRLMTLPTLPIDHTPYIICVSYPAADS